MALAQTLATQPDAARDLRYAAQRVQWQVSSIDAIRACGHHAITDSGVGIRHSVDASGKRTAGFSGLASCGSVWACAVCNHKIASERAAEVATAVRTWESSAEGRYVAMVTLTMRHSLDQALRYLWDSLGYAWSKTTSGRQWADEQAVNGSIPLTLKQQMTGQTRIPWIRFVEVTYGENGWHVHVHSLLFLEDSGDGGQHDQIGRRMFNRWSAALVRRGLVAPDKYMGGLDVKRFSPGAEDVSKYLTKSTFDHASKAGWEVAGGAMKVGKRKGRTPFQILASVVSTVDGDDALAELALWREWEQGSRGRRQVAWARGFRDWLALEDEKTDEEIAAEELDGETLGWIDNGEFKFLRDRKVELLRAAETLPLDVLRSLKPWYWLDAMADYDPSVLDELQLQPV